MLESLYIQLSETFRVGETSARDDYKAWLNESAEASAKFAGTVSANWASLLGFVSKLWPLAAGLVAAAAGATNIYEAFFQVDPTRLQRYGVMMILVAAFTGGVLVNIFLTKRNLFLGRSAYKGRSTFISSDPFERQDVYPKNVYKSEDELFELLGRGKGYEFPWDVVIAILVLGPLSGICLWGALGTGQLNILLLLVGIFFTLVVAFIILQAFLRWQ
jgi:hypothetical protein